MCFCVCLHIHVPSQIFSCSSFCTPPPLARWHDEPHFRAMAQEGHQAAGRQGHSLADFMTLTEVIRIPWGQQQGQSGGKSAGKGSGSRRHVQEAAMSRRIGSLWQSSKNYRRRMLHVLDQHMDKKVFFAVWRKAYRGEDLCREDLCWTEENMNHFLSTVASHETHARHWHQQLEMRQNPYHPCHGKEMPVLIPPDSVRIFQHILLRVHSDKLKQYFGTSSIDDILHTPFQMLSAQFGKVAESAAWVAESAAKVSEAVAQATRFQLRLFKEDTMLAIDYKTSFLNHDEGQQLVSEVRNITGQKLWIVVMNQVKELVREVDTIEVGPRGVFKGQRKVFQDLREVGQDKQPKRRPKRRRPDLERIVEDWVLNGESPMEENPKPQQDQCGGKAKGKGSGSSRACSSPVATSADRSDSGRHNPQVACWHDPQVAASAASAVDDLQHEYNQANMQDMTLQEHEYSVKGLSQIWRQSQLVLLTDMHGKKMFFMAWKRQVQGNGKDLCMEDLLWTEADMDNFLHTVGSCERLVVYGKPMPMIIPISYVHLFQNTVSQIHADKFKQHFGVATIDGTLRTPFQMLLTDLGKVAESAAWVAESAAAMSESVTQATSFQLRLFKADTMSAFWDGTTCLDHDRSRQLASGQQLVSEARMFTSRMFVMKELDQIRSVLSLIHGKLKLGYESNLAWEFQEYLRKVGQEVQPKTQRSVLSEQLPDLEKEKMDRVLNEEMPVEDGSSQPSPAEVSGFVSVPSGPLLAPPAMVPSVSPPVTC